MTIFTPTKDKGATGRRTQMTEVPPSQLAEPELLSAVAAGGGLNGRFLSDLLSAFLAHEQCGVHLYRTVADATRNPALKSRYNAFLAESERHVSILEVLIARLGGDPGYVSPSARLVHSMNTHLLAGVVLATGSADLLAREMAMLEAVVLAETKDHADWSLLQSMLERMDEGDARTAVQEAVAQVEPEEDEHIRWARDTWKRMATMQLSSSLAMKVTEFTEHAVATVKNVVTGG